MSVGGRECWDGGGEPENGRSTAGVPSPTEPLESVTSFSKDTFYFHKILFYFPKE